MSCCSKDARAWYYTIMLLQKVFEASYTTIYNSKTKITLFQHTCLIQFCLLALRIAIQNEQRSKSKGYNKH